MIRFLEPIATTPVGLWRLVEVRTGHCPGKCYVFDNGALQGPHRYHIPAETFWGKR
jgi:hypothetical protein